MLHIVDSHLYPVFLVYNLRTLRYTRSLRLKIQSSEQLFLVVFEIRYRVGRLVLPQNAAIAVSVLLNVILTIWAVTNHQLVGGISYLYTGSCSEVRDMSLWIHLGINIMSTLLLSGSNCELQITHAVKWCKYWKYKLVADTMQVLNSPTRKEVDKPHANTKWLDIGIPSIRNLGAMPRSRIIMWTILLLSSVPLHLM